MHKTALLNLDSRPKAGIHKFDVSNAHQEYERAAAAEAVANKIPELLPWVAAELCTPTCHYYTGPSGAEMPLTKDRGGDQGDATTGMIYTLLYHDVIDKTQRAARNIDANANCYAFQDDLDMVALPAAAAVASATFSEACAAVGLRANADKESWTPGRDVTTSELPQQMSIVPKAIVLKHGGGGVPSRSR